MTTYIQKIFQLDTSYLVQIGNGSKGILWTKSDVLLEGANTIWQDGDYMTTEFVQLWWRNKPCNTFAYAPVTLVLVVNRTYYLPTVWLRNLLNIGGKFKYLFWTLLIYHKRPNKFSPVWLKYLQEYSMTANRHIWKICYIAAIFSITKLELLKIFIIQ